MLQKSLGRFSDEIYSLLRLFSGLLFSFHGMQKVFGILTDRQHPVGSQLWIGGVIEVVAGLLIAAGLFTSCAAFVASGTMAVAYVQFHWKLAMGKEFLPAINKGELAVIYAFVFLYVASRGGGRYGLDARCAKKSSC